MLLGLIEEGFYLAQGDHLNVPLAAPQGSRRLPDLSQEQQELAMLLHQGVYGMTRPLQYRLVDLIGRGEDLAPGIAEQLEVITRHPTFQELRLDPLDKDMQAAIKAAEALLGKDRFCRNYIKSFRQSKTSG